MQRDAGFKLIPDPPVAGQPLEIQCPRDTKEVGWYVDNGKPKSQRVDERGRIVIDPVPSGVELVFWDPDNLSRQGTRRIDELEH